MDFLPARNIFQILASLEVFMKRKAKILGLVTLLLLLGVSVWINIDLIKSGTALSEMLSKKGTIILSPDLTQMLLSDLKTGDKDRMEQWHSYLYQLGGYDTNAIVASTGLNETFALYKSKEKPGRSNYFNRLVWDLKMKQETTPLTKQELLGFLGPPDAIMEGSGRQTLQYEYWWAGRHCVSSAVVSNEKVLSLDIYAQ